MDCYIVDAFAEKIFEGNPAAVCVGETWLADELMHKMAIEHNLSETAFAVEENDGYRLRWFTPGGEIDLCGHATLATGFVIMNFTDPGSEEVRFYTQSGVLTVRKNGELYEMDFPAYALAKTEVTGRIEQAIGTKPIEVYKGRDLVCVVESEETVQNIKIDREKALELDGVLVHVTARGTEYDCVSRSFAPKLGIDEDPVCGSGHCHIAPLWAKKLGKSHIVARQASARGGTLYCTVKNDRVILAGKAVLYAKSTLFI